MANEGLLRPSTVRLFGREFDGLIINNVDARFESTHTLQNQLGEFKDKEFQKRPDLKLARIYGFTFEGEYYQLPQPAIFIVRGEGKPPADLGIITDLQVPGDFLVWEQDKLDMTIRINTEAGTFEDLMIGYVQGRTQTGFGAKVQTGYGARMNISHRGGKLTE